VSWQRRTLAWLALLPLVPLVQLEVDERLGGYRAQEEILYVWSGAGVKRLFAGFENLMADVYWLRTVQYFGGERVFSNEKRFELLEPLVDITTTLDPRLEIAYRYGATFLSEPSPLGAGRPDAGVAVLERGARNLPRSWMIRQNLGFFTFLFLKDAKRASSALLEARKIPGAPLWLETLAADLLRKGGEREMSRRLWRRMYEEVEDGKMKKNALINLQYLDALDAIDRLNTSVEEFKRSAGRVPRSVEELRAAGLLRSKRADPTGEPFEYDPEKGTFSISIKSKIWRAL
jgi:hypothetical protein